MARVFSGLGGKPSSLARHRDSFQRGILMRHVVLTLCVFVAAGSGQRLDSATSPTAAAFGAASTRVQTGTDLPFRGSFTSEDEFTPPNARGTLTGTATHVGRFDAILEAVIDGNTSTSVGTFTLTAANGDQLSGTFEGVGEFIGPTQVKLTEEATIVSGTGRFEGATGTFTLVRVGTIGSATTASGGGTLDGRIDLNH